MAAARLASFFPPVILLLGVLTVMFCKKQSVKKIGEVILGFGILFMGLSIMGDSMEAVKESPKILNFLASLTNPFAAIQEKFVFILCFVGTRYDLIGRLDNPAHEREEHRNLHNLHQRMHIRHGSGNVVNDIERIGDHAENFADSAKDRIERGIEFSDKAKRQLRELNEKTLLWFIKSMYFSRL